MINRKFTTLAAAAAAMLAQSAGAVTAPIIRDGVFEGVSNLRTDIGAFNVTFTYGTCAEVYGDDSCRLGGAPFLFNQSQALAVGTALAFFIGQDPRGASRGPIKCNCTDFLFTPFGTAALPTDAPFGLTTGEGTLGYSVSASTGILSVGENLFAQRAVFATYTAAVPEPGTWLMLGLGFGIAGTALRRRNSGGTVVSRA